MENLNLTYYLVDLKIKNKVAVEIYFMSRVFQVHSHCYDKREKIRKAKLGKCIYFCCHPFPLRRCGLLEPPTQLFSKQNLYFFH